jgi:hypothetical protein
MAKRKQSPKGGPIKVGSTFEVNGLIATIGSSKISAYFDDFDTSDLLDSLGLRTSEEIEEFTKKAVGYKEGDPDAEFLDYGDLGYKHNDLAAAARLLKALKKLKPVFSFVKLNEAYTAVVRPNTVSVGCQDIPLSAIQNILTVAKKMQRNSVSKPKKTASKRGRAGVKRR